VPKPLPVTTRCRSIADTSMRALERRLGGRQVVGRALLLSDDPKIQAVARALLNLNHSNKPLRQIIETHAPTLTIGALLKAYGKGRADESYAAALNKIADGLPETVDHLMKTSVPHEVECPKCSGRKVVPEGPKQSCAECPGLTCQTCRGLGVYLADVYCDRCRGTGTVKATPDTERMKLALQVGGLVGSGGVQITNNQVNLTAEQTVVQTSSAFRSATDKLLYTPTQQALPPAEPSSALEQPQDAVLVEER